MNILQVDTGILTKLSGLLDMHFRADDLRQGVESYIAIKAMMESEDINWSELLIPEQEAVEVVAKEKRADDWVVLNSSYLEEDREKSYKIRFKQFDGREGFAFYAKDYAKKMADGRWKVKRWLKDKQNESNETDVAFSEI